MGKGGISGVVVVVVVGRKTGEEKGGKGRKKRDEKSGEVSNSKESFLKGRKRR